MERRFSLLYDPRTCIERVKKSMQNLSGYPFLIRYMQVGLPEYEADVVTTQPRNSLPEFGWLGNNCFHNSRVVRIWSHRSGSYTDPGSGFNFGLLRTVGRVGSSWRRPHLRPSAPNNSITLHLHCTVAL
jgi:hypothetical protein